MGHGCAWLLPMDGGRRAAVGELEMAYVATEPVTLHRVPQSPAHCREVLVWENEIIPVMDLSAWLDGRPCDDSRTIFGITAYQAAPGASPQHGALRLSGLPVRVEVDDEQACGLPDDPPGWGEVAISCFEFAHSAVPVLDLPRIFSDALLR